MVSTLGASGSSCVIIGDTSDTRKRGDLRRVPFHTYGELCSLERRVARGTGRDTIDGEFGKPEDLANAYAGASVLASEVGGGFDMMTYIRAYGGEALAAQAACMIKTESEKAKAERTAPPVQPHMRNMARSVVQPTQIVPPRDNNGDAPAIIQF
jgi:hypothetical protein